MLPQACCFSPAPLVLGSSHGPSGLLRGVVCSRDGVSGWKRVCWGREGQTPWHPSAPSLLPWPLLCLHFRLYLFTILSIPDSPSSEFGR